MKKTNSIQFISRAFPPVVGGIENQNKAIYENLSKHKQVKSYINEYGKNALFFFYPGP